MKNLSKDETRKLLVQGITVGSVFLLKKATESLIENKTSKDIPKEPDLENDQTWTEAITYAAFTGAFFGAFKLIVNRVAERKLKNSL